MKKKEWYDLTKRQQDTFIKRNADKIFICPTHGISYKTDRRTILCSDCREQMVIRYGVYKAK